MTAAGAVRASGLVGYRREPVLAFAAPGIINAMLVDAGDRVRRGQSLATLRRTSVGANADEAALARANAERDLARTQELFERGFVSQARLDDARLAVERARDSSVLTAPADGVMLRRAAEPAQMVAAGAPVLGARGNRLGHRRARAGRIGSARRASASAMQRSVRIGGAGDAPRQGRVTRIGAKATTATGAFEVEVEIAAAEGLRSGMVAEVEIAAGQRRCAKTKRSSCRRFPCSTRVPTRASCSWSMRKTSRAAAPCAPLA